VTVLEVTFTMTRAQALHDGWGEAQPNPNMACKRWDVGVRVPLTPTYAALCCSERIATPAKAAWKIQ